MGGVITGFRRQGRIWEVVTESKRGGLHPFGVLTLKGRVDGGNGDLIPRTGGVVYVKDVMFLEENLHVCPYLPETIRAGPDTIDSPRRTEGPFPSSCPTT